MEPDGGGEPRTQRARILVISDGVASGSREDLGGPALRRRLEDAGFSVDDVRVTGDGAETVASALTGLCSRFNGLVATTGGTGFGPRDLTPEGTAKIVDREAPGLAEAMRLVNPLGRLSRGIAGTRDQALILNLPGSPTGAVECLEAVLDVVPHAIELLGGGRPH